MARASKPAGADGKGPPPPTLGDPGAGPTGPVFPAEDLDRRIAAVVRPAPPTVADWLLMASYNEGLLEKEFKLQNDRISWMITSQSILFAAYCLLLLGRKDATPGTTPTVIVLLYALPILAVWIVGAALVGVRAAQRVIDELEQERSFYQAVLANIFHQPVIDVGCRRRGLLKTTQKSGSVPMRTVIAILAGIWLVILLSRIVLDVRGYS